MDIGTVPLGMTVAALMAAKSLEVLAKKPDVTKSVRDRSDTEVSSVSNGEAERAANAALAEQSETTSVVSSVSQPVEGVKPIVVSEPVPAAEPTTEDTSQIASDTKEPDVPTPVTPETFWEGVKNALASADGSLKDSIEIAKNNPEFLNKDYESESFIVAFTQVVVKAAESGTLTSKTRQFRNMFTLKRAPGGGMRTRRVKRGGKVMTSDVEMLTDMALDQKPDRLQVQNAFAVVVIADDETKAKDNSVSELLRSSLDSFLKKATSEMFKSALLAPVSTWRFGLRRDRLGRLNKWGLAGEKTVARDHANRVAETAYRREQEIKAAEIKKSEEAAVEEERKAKVVAENIEFNNSQKEKEDAKAAAKIAEKEAKSKLADEVAAVKKREAENAKQEKAIEEETAAKERSMRVNSEQTPSALAAASAANEAKEKIKSDVAAAEAEAAAKRAARTSDAEKKALVKLNERRSARADENRRRGKDFTSVGPRSGGRRKSRKSTFRRHRKH
jgi:hypothetical protein